MHVFANISMSFDTLSSHFLINLYGLTRNICKLNFLLEGQYYKDTQMKASASNITKTGSSAIAERACDEHFAELFKITQDYSKSACVSPY